MILCEACGGIPFEWVLTKHGVVNVESCARCPIPDPDGEPLHQVLGAVLYDDGSHQHWQRARETLLALPLAGLERAMVGWMRYVAEEIGDAPSLANVMAAMGPERFVGMFRWFAYYAVDCAAYARDFDRTLVEIVRQHNRTKETAAE